MSRYRYSSAERQINKVLKYQDNELEEINGTRFSMGDVEKQISESEALLIGEGYELPTLFTQKTNVNKAIIVPSWETLCRDAEKAIESEIVLEDLFTEEELLFNEKVIKQLNDDYKEIYKLDKNDITICVAAGLLGAVLDILLVGIPQKTPDGLRGGPLTNYIRDYFDRSFPEDEMNKLAKKSISKVPYDAQDNRNTMKWVEGLSAYYHRLLSLGHDPILGFIFGVVDILTGRMTTIDKKGRFVTQIMADYVDRKESDVFKAIAKQIIHFKTDITTSMGLPAPLMALFNLLQFGHIGEEEQTIAEIVQGMYYEGYDFIHFCTLSIPVMIVEVITRVGYGLKRIKEGYSIKEAIPVSAKDEFHQKLRTMLFISHSISAVINAGKVLFKKNPMAINYPQWIAFAKYSYQQVKAVIFTRSRFREAYVQSYLNEDFDRALGLVDSTFDELTDDYIIVFE